MHYFTAIAHALSYHLRSNWYILLTGIVLAVGINVYLDPAKLRSFLNRRAGLSIPGAVAFGALTPLCACGTMAVLVSMFATVMPWGAVMAFLVASPLTSPSDYMFQTAFLGSRFAITMLTSAVALGLLGGLTAYVLEKKTNFFKGQFRLAKTAEASGSSHQPPAASHQPDEHSALSIQHSALSIQHSAHERSSESGGCCGQSHQPPAASLQPASNASCCGADEQPASLSSKLKLKELGQAFWDLGVKRILLYFVLFISIGTVVEMLIPSSWILSAFGEGKAHSIPLSATIGLPLYVSSSSALPILRSFINAGAGEGAILAFLIAGKGTSLPVILGMSTFLKPKSISLYALFIFGGSICAGYLYELIMALLA